MNKYKLRIILCYIGIVLTIIVMGLTIYSFYVYKQENKENVIDDEFKKNMDIVFNDTSNLSLININSNEVYSKTFSIENKSNDVVYYNIKLENVRNNYDDKKTINYSISSDKGLYRSNEIFPSDDEVIISKIKIDRKEKHTYTLEIIKSNNEEDKTLSANINFEKSNDYNKVENNSLLKLLVDSSKSYKDYDELTSEEGVYYTNNSIDGSVIYFYRGSNNLNNNLVFNNMCFKILRSTSDGGVRVIYNGLYEDNKCSVVKVLEEKSSYNNKYNYNAYVGYMYGDASSDNYESEHNNKNSSIIKIALESWYKDNLSKNGDKISKTSFYCNYRSTNEFNINGVSYTNLGYSNNNTGYYNEKYPSYNCRNINDRLSVSGYNTSKVLNYPVGLITYDELIYAGFKENVDNVNNFLYTKDAYWTMTSAYYNASGSYNYSVNNGRIVASKVDSLLGVRPVITLNGNNIIASGDGSIESPYILR